MMLGNGTDSESSISFVSIKKVAALVIVGSAVYLIISFYIGFETLLTNLLLIPWWTLPLMMGFSLLNYVIRYMKWQYYLNRIGINLPHKDSFSVFLAGFTLTTTPLKIGETIKGVFINEIDDTPIAKTAPVVISERVTDLLAMVLLAMIGFVTGLNMLYIIAVGVLILIGALLLSQSRFYNMILMKLTSLGPMKRFQDSIELVEDTLTNTLSPRPMFVSTAISIPGWFMECMELWLLLSLLTEYGFPSFSIASLSLLLIATFVHAAASAIGALSFLPGGLGGYEAVSVLLLTTVFSLTEGIAGVATILVRLVTLWFSVIVGFIALGLVEARRKSRIKINSI
jgi:uncharacterized protein (TIRG00374 family)